MEELWEKFFKSGKIADYLEYRTLADRQEENQYAHHDKGNNSQGTSGWGK